MKRTRNLILIIVFILSITAFKSGGSLIKDQIEFTKISETWTGGDTYDVWVDEDCNLAYVTYGYSGFRIFNVSTPSNPILLSHIPESPAVINTGHSKASAHQMFVDIQENIIVYIGDGAGGLTIINCGDPKIAGKFTNPLSKTI